MKLLFKKKKKKTENSHTKHTPGSGSFTGNSYQIFKELIISILAKFFQKVEEK